MRARIAGMIWQIKKQAIVQIRVNSDYRSVNFNAELNYLIISVRTYKFSWPNQETGSSSKWNLYPTY